MAPYLLFNEATFLLKNLVPGFVTTQHPLWA